MALIRCTLPTVVPRPIRPFTSLFVSTFADIPRSPSLVSSRHELLLYSSRPIRFCLLPFVWNETRTREYVCVRACEKPPSYCERINPDLHPSERVIEITVRCFSPEKWSSRHHSRIPLLLEWHNVISFNESLSICDYVQPQRVARSTRNSSGKWTAKIIEVKLRRRLSIIYYGLLLGRMQTLAKVKLQKVSANAAVIPADNGL